MLKVFEKESVFPPNCVFLTTSLIQILFTKDILIFLDRLNVETSDTLSTSFSTRNLTLMFTCQLFSKLSSQKARIVIEIMTTVLFCKNYSQQGWLVYEWLLHLSLGINPWYLSPDLAIITNHGLIETIHLCVFVLNHPMSVTMFSKQSCLIFKNYFCIIIYKD